MSVPVKGWHVRRSCEAKLGPIQAFYWCGALRGALASGPPGCPCQVFFLVQVPKREKQGFKRLTAERRRGGGIKSLCILLVYIVFSERRSQAATYVYR